MRGVGVLWALRIRRPRIESSNLCRRLRPVLKRLLHWIIFVAAALQLLSCIFGNGSHMPAVPF